MIWTKEIMGKEGIVEKLKNIISKLGKIQFSLILFTGNNKSY